MNLLRIAEQSPERQKYSRKYFQRPKRCLKDGRKIFLRPKEPPKDASYQVFCQKRAFVLPSEKIFRGLFPIDEGTLIPGEISFAGAERSFYRLLGIFSASEKIFGNLLIVFRAIVLQSAVQLLNKTKIVTKS